MRINKDITIRDLERFHGCPEFEMSLAKSTDYSPTVLASLIHFLLGELRKQESILIKLDIDITEIKNVLSKHYEYFHILAISLFHTNVQFYDKNNRSIPLDTLKYGFKKARQVQEFAYSQSKDKKLPPNSLITPTDLQEYRTHLTRNDRKHAKGITFGLACFDHLSKEKLDQTIYLNPRRVSKNWQDISLWVSRLFDFNSLIINDNLSSSHSIDDISNLIFELFDNTNEWGKTSYNDQFVYKPNYRSCIINAFLRDQIEDGFSAYEETINGYLKDLTSVDLGTLGIPNLQSNLFEEGELGILEISVSDTGPGMARRLLGKDYPNIGEAEQIHAVIKCFQKYLTSDTSGTKQVRGRGLSKVIQVIGKTGLVRVRSGSVSIARNFLQHPVKTSEFKDGIEFDRQDYLSTVEGTCISILYPFKYKVK